MLFSNESLKSPTHHSTFSVYCLLLQLYPLIILASSSTTIYAFLNKSSSLSSVFQYNVRDIRSILQTFDLKLPTPPKPHLINKKPDYCNVKVRPLICLVLSSPLCRGHLSRTPVRPAPHWDGQLSRPLLSSS